jgi:signal transduction histidine kinase
MPRVGPSQRALAESTDLGVHDHVCVLGAAAAAAEAFILDGIVRGQRCIYITADRDRRPQLEALGAAGSLEVFDCEVFLRHEGHAFEPDRMIGWLLDQTAAAIADGFDGLRVVEEMWCIGSDPHVARLAEYEAKLHREIARSRLAAMCIYDRTAFAPAAIGDALVTHPLAVIDDVLCRSTHFVPSATYLASDRAGEVQYILDQIVATHSQRAWSQTMLDTIETERREVARVLHDQIGQLLATVDADNAQIGEALEIVCALARDIRPSLLDDFGLAAALGSLARRKARAAGLRIELALEDTRLAIEIAETCYRIAAAAIANVVQHAHASVLAVSLRSARGVLELAIGDDGVGFGAAQIGPGLTAMRMRAELAGGELVIESRAGRTTIVACVPV